MRIFACCPWLGWEIDVKCDFAPTESCLLYYFQMFDEGKLPTHIECNLRTQMVITELPHDVMVMCGEKQITVPKDCHRILGAVAEFCQDDFLNHPNDSWCVLHGAAVSADGKSAFLFLAPTGAGKSTLAYYACIHGFALCTDDVIVLNMATGMLLPFPKPIYLRNADFLPEYLPKEEPNWHRYAMEFELKITKYPVIPSLFVRKPLKIASMHFYERGTQSICLPMTFSEQYRELLFSSLAVSDRQLHCEHLVKLLDRVTMDRIRCDHLDEFVLWLFRLANGDREENFL